jgi:hypothetical protein
MPCDPARLWVEHEIRWCDHGKKGPGWYKYKNTGRAHLMVKLTKKECPLCGYCFHEQDISHSYNARVRTNHPRPVEWLEAEDKQARNDSGKAAAAAAFLLADARKEE